MKKLGILLLFTGIMMIAWSGYSWWEQTQAVTSNAKELHQQYENWDDTAYQQQVKSITDDQKSLTKSYQHGEEVGKLEIPRIGNQYDIYWGTGADTLKKGVGMYDSKWTVKPDIPGHVVLSGHRETVFRQLNEVKKGDHLYVSYEGKTYDYQIRKTWITDAEDRSVIVDKNKPTLTLTTCYPFDFVGSAPERYIVQAELVSVDKNG
ncbi:class D sortase [Thalassobacillus pellis]|uniref:class D sortase n=1 Tax=Thalassobacillus pellis TaxID=748008 RepID=UPI0019621232|nr:class D sortase [Thalassobacillus pellis]MBM7553927.1 sortase A [Thalassobacillus pellis]